MAKKKKKIIPESEMITITRKEYDYLLSFFPGRRICENAVYHARSPMEDPFWCRDDPQFTKED